MAEDQRIVEGIEALRAEVAPLAQAARSVESLRRDLAPRVEEAVRALIVELADVESDFQLEDLLALVKKSMRNVRTFNRALDQLGGFLSLVDNLEPLPGKFPFPGVGPFSLLKESLANHWGKMMFRWVYWELMMRGKDLPLENQMNLAGKMRAGAACKM